jgi:hypothetical protein
MRRRKNKLIEELRVGDGFSRTHCHIWLMKTGYPYRLQALKCIE